MPRRPDKELIYRPELHYESNGKILREFGKVFIEYLIENEDGVQLPGLLGTVQIIGKKKRALDYKNTSKYGKLIFHTNENTGGYKYFPKWFNRLRKNKKTRNKTSLEFFFFKLKSYDLLKNAIKKKIDEKDYQHWRKTN